MGLTAEDRAEIFEAIQVAVQASSGLRGDAGGVAQVGAVPLAGTCQAADHVGGTVDVMLDADLQLSGGTPMTCQACGSINVGDRALILTFPAGGAFAWPLGTSSEADAACFWTDPGGSVINNTVTITSLLSAPPLVQVGVGDLLQFRFVAYVQNNTGAQRSFHFEVHITDSAGTQNLVGPVQIAPTASASWRIAIIDVSAVVTATGLDFGITSHFGIPNASGAGVNTWAADDHTASPDSSTTSGRALFAFDIQNAITFDFFGSMSLASAALQMQGSTCWGTIIRAGT